MRLLILASAALVLSACGQSPLKTEAVPDAAADAAAVDNAVPAADPGAEPGDSDARGTVGTAPPDATGEPGVTLPTTPPSDGGAADPTH